MQAIGRGGGGIIVYYKEYLEIKEIAFKFEPAEP